MRPDRRKTNRKTAIIDTFESLIRKHGIDRITMAEVAREVGVSVGTLYNEFADKEALIDALMQRIEDDADRRLTGLTYSSSSPDGQLLELLNTTSGIVGDLIRNNRSLADYIFGGSHYFRYIGKKVHADFFRGRLLSNEIASLIRKGIDAGIFKDMDVENTANAITNAFTTYSISRVTMENREKRSTAQDWRLCFELMVRGLVRT